MSGTEKRDILALSRPSESGRVSPSEVHRFERFREASAHGERAQTLVPANGHDRICAHPARDISGSCNRNTEWRDESVRNTSGLSFTVTLCFILCFIVAAPAPGANGANITYTDLYTIGVLPGYGFPNPIFAAGGQ